MLFPTIGKKIIGIPVFSGYVSAILKSVTIPSLQCPEILPLKRETSSSHQPMSDTLFSVLLPSLRFNLGRICLEYLIGDVYSGCAIHKLALPTAIKMSPMNFLPMLYSKLWTYGNAAIALIHRHCGDKSPTLLRLHDECNAACSDSRR